MVQAPGRRLNVPVVPIGELTGAQSAPYDNLRALRDFRGEYGFYSHCAVGAQFTDSVVIIAELFKKAFSIGAQ